MSVRPVCTHTNTSSLLAYAHAEARARPLKCKNKVQKKRVKLLPVQTRARRLKGCPAPATCRRARHHWHLLLPARTPQPRPAYPTRSATSLVTFVFGPARLRAKQLHPRRQPPCTTPPPTTTRAASRWPLLVVARTAPLMIPARTALTQSCMPLVPQLFGLGRHQISIPNIHFNFLWKYLGILAVVKSVKLIEKLNTLFSRLPRNASSGILGDEQQKKGDGRTMEERIV